MVLGLTGKSHGSIEAGDTGLEGDSPQTVCLDSISSRITKIKEGYALALMGSHPITFDQSKDLKLHKEESLPLHTNGMLFNALDGDKLILQRSYYSVGGGFSTDETKLISQSRKINRATVFIWLL